jgi:hypothetical protein
MMMPPVTKKGTTVVWRKFKDVDDMFADGHEEAYPSTGM